MNLDTSAASTSGTTFAEPEHHPQPISVERSGLPILIIQTGTALPRLRARQGDFPHWFRIGMKLRSEHVHIVNVQSGENLPDARSVAAAVITGSGAMVTDRHDWSESTADWLRGAMQQHLPMFGVCYGHQLMAHAFGGEVKYNPRGREMGTIHIDATPQAASDVLFAPMGVRYRAHATHLQSVIKPPVHAAILASSALEDYHALRYAPLAWSVQFHPEFSAEAMRGYIRERTLDLQREGSDPARLLANVAPCPAARTLLQRFLRLATAPRRDS